MMIRSDQDTWAETRLVDHHGDDYYVRNALADDDDDAPLDGAAAAGGADNVLDKYAPEWDSAGHEDDDTWWDTPQRGLEWAIRMARLDHADAKSSKAIPPPRPCACA